MRNYSANPGEPFASVPDAPGVPLRYPIPQRHRHASAEGIQGFRRNKHGSTIIGLLNTRVIWYSTDLLPL